MNRASPPQPVLRAARGISIVEIMMPLLIGLFTGYASVLRFAPNRMLIGISLPVSLLAVATSALTKKGRSANVTSAKQR